MCKNLSAKYYQDNKDCKKKDRERYQTLSKTKKKRQLQSYVENGKFGK